MAAKTVKEQADGSEQHPAVTWETAPAELDAAALERAREEAVVEAGDQDAVGDVVDVRLEETFADGAGRVVTVRFAAVVPGYRGWQWSVTLVEWGRGATTVSEVVLLPGPEALLAPAWVPWKDRVRGGDLGVGDLLPTAPDDVRVVPAYVQSDDPAVEELAREIGLGRVRVLSREGRADAAERWHLGDYGPSSEMAKHAPDVCAACAFFVPVAGALGGTFGICANEYSPADGHVVDARFGCGAHSEAQVRRAAASATGDVVVDELALEVHQRAEELVAADLAATADLLVESELAGSSRPATGGGALPAVDGEPDESE